MIFKRIRQIAMSIGIILIIGASVYAQNDSEYAFAFAVQEGETITFYRLNMTTDRIETQSTLLELPPAWSLTEGLANPHHDWVALNIRSSPLSSFQLFNTVTGEVREIADGFNFSPAPSGMSYPLQEFSWSSTGQYVAYNTIVSEDGERTGYLGTHTQLYDLENDILTNLGVVDVFQSRLAWSNHDDRLAIATTNCTQDPCENYIDIYDAATGTLSAHHTIPLIELKHPRSAGRGDICELDWSPDDRYLSFVSTCDSSNLTATKELYLLDTVTDEMRRISNFSYPQVSDDEFNTVVAHYRTVWIDNDHLLVSTVYGVGDEQQAEIYLYSLEDDVLNKLDDGWVFNLALNPLGNSFGYQFFTRTNWDDYQYASQIHLGELGNDLSQLSFIDQTQANPRLGCFPSWSPDGRLLAYYITRANHCMDTATSFWLMDADSQAIRGYMPTMNSTAFTYVLGWVQR